MKNTILNLSGEDIQEQIDLASMCEPVKIKIEVILNGPKVKEIPVYISNETLILCLENIARAPIVSVDKFRLISEIYNLSLNKNDLCEQK